MKKNKLEGSCTGVSVGDEERVAIEDHSEREFCIIDFMKMKE